MSGNGGSAAEMSNHDVDTFFNNLNTMLSSISNANSAWDYISQSLTNYAIGSSASDQGCLAGLEGTLLENWSGSAAGEFQKKIDAVKKFMLNLASNANPKTKTSAFAVALAGVQAQLSWIQRQKSSVVDPAYQNWRAQVARMMVQAMGGNGVYHWFDDQAHGTSNIFILSGAWEGISTFGESVTSEGINAPSKPIVVDNFEAFSKNECAGGAQATILWKPDHTLTYSDPGSGDSWSGSHAPKNALFGSVDLDATASDLADWLTSASTNAYHNVLRQALSQVSDQYVKLVSSLPRPLDNSGIGQPGGETGPGLPGGPGGLGDNPFGNGSGSPGTGLTGLGPGNPNPGAFNPNALSPNGFNPGGLGSGSPGGGWDPSRLAGFNPAGVGGGLGSTGFGDGTGLNSGAGLDGGSGLGAGGAGAGADGANSGLAGAAGRAMPMAPMAGAGAGKDSDGRQRAVYLTEDEEVWGANGEGGAAVL